jgi:hypothetical protein
LLEEEHPLGWTTPSISWYYEAAIVLPL